MRKYHIYLAVFTILLAISITIISAPIKASAAASECKKSSSSFLGFPTWYKYLQSSIDDKENCVFHNLDLTNTPNAAAKILLAIVEILLRIAGIVSVIFVIWGGFIYMTSQGQPDRLKVGQSTILNALIGVIISVLAVVIVNVVGGSIA